MKSIPVESVRPLLYPDGILYLDEDYVLCSPDVPVSENLVKRLKAWNYKTILIDESVKPQTKTLAQNLSEGDVTHVFLDDENRDTKDKKKTQEIYVTFLENLQQSLDNFNKKGALYVDEIANQAKEIYAALKDYHRFLLQLTILDRNGFPYLTCHSVNTAILSMAIGENLKIPPHRIIEIGMAGLLHEIGMLHQSFAKIQTADRKLTPEELKTLKAHPVLSYKILKEKGFPANTCLGALGHHEKEDGSGYPQGLNKENIPSSAKIIAVASAYDAMVSSRPFRPAIDGYSAILEIIKEIGKTYHDQVVRHLIAVIGFVPLGTLVELKNGSYALVHSINTKDVKKPFLKVLTSTDKKPISEHPLVQLGQSPEWELLKAYSREEYHKLKAQGLIEN